MISGLFSRHMEKLKNEINGLIDKLKNEFSGENSVESFALTHLVQFLREMEKSGNAGLTDIVFEELKQFWLESVPWCSELSRDIEKLIIMYEDLRDEGIKFS